MREKRPNACIFISYASEQRSIAESISLALLNLGSRLYRVGKSLRIEVGLAEMQPT
jgi:hypothetical protein